VKKIVEDDLMPNLKRLGITHRFLFIQGELLQNVVRKKYVDELIEKKLY